MNPQAIADLALMAALLAVVTFIGWHMRRAVRVREDAEDQAIALTKPPAQDAPEPPPGPGSEPAPGRAAGPPAAVPAPGHENLGPCYVTIHHHGEGLVIVNHVLGTRRVLRNSEGDAAWVARFERELGQL